MHPPSRYSRTVSLPESQSRYQVRFAWGVAGGNAIAGDAHVVVWVDVLPDAALKPCPLCGTAMSEHVMDRADGRPTYMRCP